jgi:serine/threonine protein phosphatase PrpC
MQCKKFDAFLMCSDGFWELIEEKQMIKLLKKAQSVEEWLDSMVSEVMSNGKGKDMDNNSAIAVWVEE